MENTLGKRIVHNRKRLGLTQDQLAEQLGVTAQAVSKWENDQSCPDITMLPRLAEIFAISTDELLGHETTPKTSKAEVIDEADDQKGGHAVDFELQFDNSRKGAICLAITVLSVGILYLLSNTLYWNASFWDILWPASLTMFGLFGLHPRFSFFRFGCMLFGIFSLLINLTLLPFALTGKIIWPAILIIFGLSLLADALKKPRKGNIRLNGKPLKHNNNLNIDADRFDFSASFGENTQYITLPCLRDGSVSTSFGSYVVDFSGVETLAKNCCVDVNCAFGSVTLLIPRKFIIRPTTSTTFAEFTVDGEPDRDANQFIQLPVSVSFGEIIVQYI